LEDSYYYGEDGLRCEDVALSKIAESAGTPTYVYSYDALEKAYRELEEAFSGLDHMICYAVKANSNLTVLRVLASFGAGADIV
jgi:diaminopimelate decarboxylase